MSQTPVALRDGFVGHAARQASPRLLGHAAESEPGRPVDLSQRRPAPAADHPIRVVIAGAHALVRAGYRSLIESDSRIAVVGEAPTASQAIAVTEETGAQIVLLDLALPDLSDQESTIGVVSHPGFAEVAVMLITSSDRDERVHSAVRAGAVGVLAEEADQQELIRAVNAVARGDAFLSAEAVRRLRSELPQQWLRHRPLSQELVELTDREREVVTLVALGLTTDGIADKLVISPMTARTHVSRAMFKVGAHTRSQLVVLAYESGLVRPRGFCSQRITPGRPAEPTPQPLRSDEQVAKRTRPA